MPREEETIRSVGPWPAHESEVWPADREERIRLAREVTLGVRAKYLAAEHAHEENLRSKGIEEGW